MYEKELEDKIYKAIQEYVNKSHNKVTAFGDATGKLLTIFNSLMCSACLEADTDFEQFVYRLNGIYNQARKLSFDTYKQLKGENNE